MIKKVILLISFACSIVNGSTLNVGLIGHYKFEGDANDINNSGNNLQVIGSSEFIPSGHHNGQALRTNGDQSIWYNGGGYMNAGFLVNNNNISALTFNFWTRNDASGGPLSPSHTEEAWVEVGYGDGTPPSITIGTRALGASGNINGTSPAINWADWKMLTLSITSSEWIAYLNGIEFQRMSLTSNPFPTQNVQFGSHTWNNGAGKSARMTVEWDDMRIYDRELSSTEVAQIYAIESVPEPSSVLLLLVGGAVLMTGKRRNKCDIS